MRDALASLVRAGRLRQEPASRQEISRFLESADTAIADAGIAALSASGRFKHAYDAAHTLALCALRAHGLRPASVAGHRAIVFELLGHTIGADPTLYATLLRYHTRRNKSEYEGLATVSEAEARELLDLARSLRSVLQAWLQGHRPALIR